MSKRLVVLVCALAGLSFAISSAGATPLSHSARLATANSKVIAIPFTPGRASIAKVTATLTEASSGPSNGVPFTLSVGNLAKLSSKIRVAAIGGMTGLSPVPPPAGTNGPPSTKLTYEILVAIDATAVRKTAGRERVTGGGDALNLIFEAVGTAETSSFLEEPEPCRNAESKVETYKAVPIKGMSPEGLSSFKNIYRKDCP